MLNTQLKTGFVLFREKKSQYTQVNNLFIDNFLEKADGEFVKVYLLLIRINGESEQKISIDEIANKLEISVKKVIRAFEYWQKEGLINVIYSASGEPIKLEVVEDIENAIDKGNSINTKPTDEYNMIRKDEIYSENIDYKRYTFINDEQEKEHISKIPRFEDVSFNVNELNELKENNELAVLVRQYEYYIQRTLSNRELNFLLYMYKVLKFDVNLIEYLIEQCISKNNNNLSYMIKIALDWANSEIRTVEEAKIKNSIWNAEYFSIMKNLGLPGKITPEHKEKFTEWLDMFSIDMVIEACKRSIRNLGHGNLNYVDRILNNWKKDGITEIDQIYDNDKLKKDKARVSNNTKNIDKAQTQAGVYSYKKREIDYGKELGRLMSRNWNEVR